MGLIFKVLPPPGPAIIHGTPCAEHSDEALVARSFAAPRRARGIMKSPFAVRLGILIGAMFLVAGGTIYGLASAWHRVHQLQSKFNSPQFQSFQLANEVRRGLQSLNGS